MKDDFETEVLTRLAKIETKLDDYSKNREKTDEAFSLSKVNEKKIEEINDKIQWITRITAGAIITGVIGIGIIIFKTGMGVG